MSQPDQLTKFDVRGRRNVKSKTKKDQPHIYDDEKQIKGHQRKHARMIPLEEHDDLDLDIDDLEELDPTFNWKKIL